MSGAVWLHFVIALLLAVSSAGAAGTQPDDSSYRELVKRVTSGDISIDFRALRFACLKADNCDPTGDSKDVVAMRRAVQEKQYDKAVKAAEGLIQKGFVNIEAHAICSDAYAALENREKAKFHHDVTSALIRSILSTGDGKTKETAFEVVNVHEEYIIVSVLGFPRPGSQSLIRGKGHSYDLLEVVQPGTGQTIAIYFKIDAFYPMKGL
jgi:hypothetical protein